MQKWSCVMAGLVLQGVSARAANLVANPDFNAGMTGWTNIGSGIVSIDDTDGSPAAPSLRETGVALETAVVWTDCIQLAAAQNVDVFANIKLVSGDSAIVLVQGYTDTGCINSTFPPVFLSPTVFQSGPWRTVSETNTALPNGTQGVRVALQTTSTSGNFDAYFDHILFGPTGSAPVRLQSFEVK